MSKAARAQSQSQNRTILEGFRVYVPRPLTWASSYDTCSRYDSAYTSEILARRGHADPERTPDMTLAEEALITSLAEQKTVFKSACREDWLEPYIDWLHRRIEEKAQDVLNTISLLPSRSPKSWDEDTLEYIHAQRRIISGYHQESELCRLEDGVYEQVTTENMYILKGAWCVLSLNLNTSVYSHSIYSFNRLFFKRTYKF